MPAEANERTALLSNQTPSSSESQTQAEQIIWPEAGGIKDETHVLWNLYWPLWTTQLLDNVILIANVVVVGHLGVNELAAMQLSTSTVSVLGMSVIYGLNSALDTLTSQGWTSDSPKQIGLHAQRQLLISGMILIPILILLWNARPVLLLLRQDPEVADIASRVLKIHGLFLVPFAVHDVTQRWLAAQSRVRIATGVLLVACPFSILLNWALVWHYQMGVIGSPLATVITWCFMAIAIVLYSIFFVPRDGWPGFTWRAFTGLGPNIKLGCAGLIMSLCDWVVWEVFTVAAGAIGPVEMATQSILFNAQLVFFQSAIASASASAVRMGNLLGAGNPKQARLVLHILTVFSVSVGCIYVAITYPNLRRVARIFTDDQRVVALLIKVAPVICFYQVADQLQGSNYGPFRATGRLGASALITLVSFWLIGLPLAFFLCFNSKYNMGLYGLWIGMGIGSLFAAVGETGFTHLFIDYEHEALRARERNDKAAAELSIPAPRKAQNYDPQL